jgi:phosphotransferase system  glucose/maltose/N-acetylglucosamine-specific IIC component
MIDQLIISFSEFKWWTWIFLIAMISFSEFKWWTWIFLIAMIGMILCGFYFATQISKDNKRERERKKIIEEWKKYNKEHKR